MLGEPPLGRRTKSRSEVLLSRQICLHDRHLTSYGVRRAHSDEAVHSIPFIASEARFLLCVRVCLCFRFLGKEAPEPLSSLLSS